MVVRRRSTRNELVISLINSILTLLHASLTFT